MHSSRGRSSRQHAGNVDDNEPMLIPRADESRSENYHRTQQYPSHSKSYRSSTSSHRAAYEASREASSSRRRRESEEWRSVSSKEHYAFSSSGGYRDRDDYDLMDSKERDRWSSRDTEEVRFPPGREWTQRSSYVENSRSPSASWWDDQGYGNGRAYRDRKLSYGAWNPEDTHPPDGGGEKRRSHDDPYREQDWRRDKRDSKWRSDQGWTSHRKEERERGWADKGWNGTTTEETSRPPTERTWDASERWHASHGESTRNQTTSRSSNKKGRKIKNKRDWRKDDSRDLNNWSKRENQVRTPTKRRHLRSTSRSRSRSPALSAQSNRTSKARSKSRSQSPKRPRREASPLAASGNRATNERGRKAWSNHVSGKHSTSPIFSRKDRAGRCRSRSSASTSSRSRSSRSRSPVNRPRAVHRLPTSTPLKDVSITSSKPINGNDAQFKDQKPKRIKNNNRNSTNRVEAKSNNQESKKMPPPAKASSPARASSLSGVDLQPETRIGPKSKLSGLKKAGFKPIGLSSSSLKRFFPGDDEDVVDIPQDRPTQKAVYVRPEEEPRVIYTRNEEPQNRALVASTKSSTTKRDSVAENPIQHGDFTTSPTWLPEGHSSLPESSSHPDALQEADTNAANANETFTQGRRGELYAILNQVGEGTFGKVYKARNTMTKVNVALKRIRMESEREGFPVTAMREIKLLQSLGHDNVVRLFEMMVSNSSVYMVFEYMDHDLTGVLSQTQFNFTESHLKSLCQQMLRGLAYLHHKGVIHRDIKGSNILLNNRGELKLADFGLARFYQKRRRADYTNRVITLWYRPPELLFGATVYGPEVDMWSAGCIMLELYTKKPVFQGNDEIHQLDVIYKVFGTPTLERWPGVTNLPWYELVKPREEMPNHFKELFRNWLSPSAMDLAESLLNFDPSQRATAVQALDAPYFTQEEPRPELPIGLATLEGEWHELETKRERAKKRRKTEQ